MIKIVDNITFADVEGLIVLPILETDEELGELKIMVISQEKIYIDIKKKIVNYLKCINDFWDKTEYSFNEWDYMDGGLNIF